MSVFQYYIPVKDPTSLLLTPLNNNPSPHPPEGLKLGVGVGWGGVAWGWGGEVLGGAG